MLTNMNFQAAISDNVKGEFAFSYIFVLYLSYIYVSMITMASCWKRQLERFSQCWSLENLDWLWQTAFQTF